MPLMLTPAERAMLDGLAAPVSAERRPEFLGAVSTKLEAAGPAAIGEGSVHRAARSVIADFWSALLIFVRGVSGREDPEANRRLELASVVGRASARQRPARRRRRSRST